MRFGRQSSTPEARIYNPGDEFRTKDYGNRESFLMPAFDAIWSDPQTGDQPESVPGVMRLRPKGYQDAVNREVSPPTPVRVAHKTEDVLAWLLGDDGKSGQIGSEPRFCRELSPSDDIDAEADAAVIAEARRAYLVGRVRTAENAVARHEGANAERKAKGIGVVPPSGQTKKEYEFLARLQHDKGVQCPKCGESYSNIAALKPHIDTIHGAEKDTLYSEAGIVTETPAPRRGRPKKAVVAA
jgi:hypothetical protein